MQRIIGDDVAEDLFGAGKDGFTDGDPGISAATVLTPEFCNQVQEEIVSLIETCGLTPDATTTQLYNAIKGHNWTFLSTIKSSNATGFAATVGDVRAASNFEYCDATGAAVSIPRTIQIPITNCIRTGSTVPHAIINDGGDISCVAISAPAISDGWLYSFVLPFGAELTSVSAGVIQLNAGSTVDMQLHVYRHLTDSDMSGDPTVNSLGSDATPAGAGGKVFTVPVAASAYVQHTLNTLTIHIRASDSGLATDSVHWITVSFNDPGPRNF